MFLLVTLRLTRSQYYYYYYLEFSGDFGEGSGDYSGDYEIDGSGITDTTGPILVKNVAKSLTAFLDTNKDFQTQIYSLEIHFQDLNALDQEAWNHESVQKVIRSLNSALDVLRRVGEKILQRTRASSTDVTELESNLMEFQRLVHDGLSTDNSYSEIMTNLGGILSVTDEIMKKEIVDINKAESLMNTADAEMRNLKTLLEIKRKEENERFYSGLASGVTGVLGAATSLFSSYDADYFSYGEEDSIAAVDDLVHIVANWGTFDRIENNILEGFQYFKEKKIEMENDERAVRKLREDYQIIRIDKDVSYHQDILEEVAEDDDDWESDIMFNVRSLKKSVNDFIASAGIY